MVEADASFPYHEPNIKTILILSSFLLLLNALNYVLDKALYCGLLGQILLGIAWGSPGAKWLGQTAEGVIVELGYLGLILIVYEGGLSTSFTSLRANIAISAVVAITGICAPIGLSFVLHRLIGANPLQAFAAGAALCSTSLGTTFTVLGTSGLTKTRLGVVLTSAAMMDDVVGLVMVQVISSLGRAGASFDAITVVRPVLVSLGFAILTPLCCWLAVRPLSNWLKGYRETYPDKLIPRVCASQVAILIIQTGILLAFVAGGSYAGTSNLFTAYLAGACVSWWVVEFGQPKPNTEREGSRPKDDASAITDPALTAVGMELYEKYFQQAVDRILKPFFFASIGFSIPISEMFKGSVVWRGLVFTCLMVFGKLICGIWLIKIPLTPPMLSKVRGRGIQVLKLFQCWKQHELKKKTHPQEQGRKSANIGESRAQGRQMPQTLGNEAATSYNARQSSNNTPSRHKPLSLYPAAILGNAMVARGEIGFLISSLAESQGIFSSNTGGSDIFLVVTWAIMLCTIIGPFAVGLLVKRVKRLQETTRATQSEGNKGVLGDWDIR